MFDNTFGVWANRDCELVRTAMFSLLFERAGQRVAAVLARLDPGEGTVTFDVRAAAVFDEAARSATLKAKDPVEGDEVVMDTDFRDELTLGANTCDLAGTGDGLVLGFEGRKVEELAADGTVLRVLTPSGRWQELDLLERILPGPPFDGRPADRDGIAECLQQWALGTSLWHNPGTDFTGLNIGTNRHGFGFSFGMLGGVDVVFCHASRVRATSEGAVFSQHVRLMDNPDEFTMHMADDCAAAGLEDVVVDPARFAEDAETGDDTCWALKEFTDDLIVLRRAGGGEYRCARPRRDAPTMLEWFRFRDYAAAAERPRQQPARGTA